MRRPPRFSLVFCGHLAHFTCLRGICCDVMVGGLSVIKCLFFRRFIVYYT